jgi:transposase
MAKTDPRVSSKIAFLRLAEELGNVSQACRIMGYSRDSYYRLKKQYDKGGEGALVNQSRSRQLRKNQVAEEIQQRVLEFAYENPDLGQRAVAEKLTAQGMKISHNGVRSVWLRYDLETRQKRLEALKAKSDQGELLITEKQMEAFRLLASRFTDDSGELISRFPGYLLVQDTFEVDHFHKLGRLYLHIAVDSYTRYTFARYTLDKDAESCRRFLVEDVIPWSEQQGLRLQKVLTDRGSEFYSSKTPNAYQTLLREKGIEHLLVKAYNSSQLNGLCRQFEKLVETEFLSTVARNNQNKRLWKLQERLDSWMDKYNSKTAQPARYCYGKTPAETLAASLHLCPTT